MWGKALSRQDRRAPSARGRQAVSSHAGRRGVAFAPPGIDSRRQDKLMGEKLLANSKGQRFFRRQSSG